MNKRIITSLFWAGIFLLLVPGLLHAYLLMPFPGSQDLEAITFVYYLEKIVLPLRIIGFLLVLWPLWHAFAKGRLSEKITKGGMVLVCLGVFYFSDHLYRAERMFEEPQIIRFASSQSNQVPDTLLVLGVVEGSVAKAYPVNYLGYHHKVQDSVGQVPVLVTYCTMCRTGRVFSPVINGTHQTFRLVGARHYNAVIEDASTKSWWYQATGEAAVGPLQGRTLKEITYEQLTLRSWLEKYPNSLILQPDTNYLLAYDDLKRYDRLQPIDKDSTLKSDTLIRKSWVVGITVDEQAKAYDWRELIEAKVVNDLVGKTPVVVTIEPDSLSFHVWNRNLEGNVLHFESDEKTLWDRQTNSTWNWQGECVSGLLTGKKLKSIQAHQEYWHSWQQFHSPTLFWRGEKSPAPTIISEN
ncbi:DUF3179 domain-containing (seleno)protein [Rhodocytophaga aerolata]|uniref:DUF3179 domain-containing (Seleno)protein n=1 Tax=Rhodocytophaga aerolata TaxID=455078 RepID=A0ABT8QYT6_9BACT|nr:DUF3179 domain-containing (seleno)protein [Rhodocytophaga aerolata]MDO1445008.1 DUF3179 domain-containing (seleno)protein [Rhodocytophaga aerolata]